VHSILLSECFQNLAW